MFSGWGWDVRSAERCACRSGGRYRENRPAFQAVRAIGADLDLHCRGDSRVPLLPEDNSHA